MSNVELRNARRKVGLSIAALAAKSQVSRWRMIEFELGNVSLRPDEVERIKVVLRRSSDAKIAELGGLVGIFA